MSVETVNVQSYCDALFRDLLNAFLPTLYGAGTKRDFGGYAEAEIEGCAKIAATTLASQKQSELRGQRSSARQRCAKCT